MPWSSPENHPTCHPQPFQLCLHASKLVQCITATFYLTLCGEKILKARTARAKPGLPLPTRHLQKIVLTRLLLLRTNFLTKFQKLRVFQIVGALAMATPHLQKIVLTRPLLLSTNFLTWLQKLRVFQIVAMPLPWRPVISRKSSQLGYCC